MDKKEFIPFPVLDIVCHEIDALNPKTPQEYINLFFNHQQPMTHYRGKNEIECFSNCSRSFQDIYSLVCTKYGKLSIGEVADMIFRRIISYQECTRNILGKYTTSWLYCPDVNKLVFYCSEYYGVTSENCESFRLNVANGNMGKKSNEDYIPDMDYNLDAFYKDLDVSSNRHKIKRDDNITLIFLIEEIKKFKKEQELKKKEELAKKESKVSNTANRREVPQGKKLIGVYGSLKRGYHNHVLLSRGGAIHILTKEISIPYEMISLGGFPGLIKARVNHRVLMEIYEVDEKVYKDVECLEGYPHFYDKYEVTNCADCPPFEIYVLNEERENYSDYPKTFRISW